MENTDNKESVKRVRMNVYLVQELKDYVDEQAKNYGLSTSAYMTMLISNYRMQHDALANLGNAKEMLDRLEQLGK